MIKSEEIISVQYLRGLAALGVVCFHYGQKLPLYPHLSALFGFGWSGVEVFFFISGFIIVYSLNKKNYKTSQFFRFLLKRSVRIDSSYFTIIILTLIFWRVVYLITAFPPDKIDFVPAQFIAHLFNYVCFTRYKFYNPVFWTLSIEFQFYLLIGLLFFLTDSRIYKYIFLIIFSALSFFPILNDENIVFSYAPIFSLGISLVNFYERKSLVNGLLPVVFLTAIGFRFGLPILTLLTFSCLFILYFKLIIRPLHFLGNISYSLYLTHFLTIAVMLIAMNHLHVVRADHQLLCLFCEVLVACGAAYVFYILVEKPSIMLSKRINYKKQIEINYQANAKKLQQFKEQRRSAAEALP